MYYFDNSATTPTRKEVASLVAEYSINNYYNPSSVYANAIKVKNDIDGARQDFLHFLGVKSGNIIFTGSATESNNIILNGLARKNQKILISEGEHPSIYETAKNLINLGYEISFIKLNKDGSLCIEDLLQQLDDKVGLVSFIHVSNENGVINDIATISKLIKNKAPNCFVHCDGVQAFGKIEVNLSQTKVDAYTISAHKIYGPKGIALLYYNNQIKLKQSIFGGGQEFGVRSGTQNTPAIMGFALAGEIITKKLNENIAHNKAIQNAILEELNKKCTNYIINTPENSVANILSVSFLGVRGEVILHYLEQFDICISTGSACSSKVVGNRVLKAMGQDTEIMQGNLRLSFGEFNTVEQAQFVVQKISEAVDKFRLNKEKI